MHSTKIKDTLFLHNGDYKGDVTVRRNGQEFVVPGEDLLEFAGGAVAAAMIAKLEQMSGCELLRVLAQVKKI